MKFRTIQKVSSIIPYYSTFFILLITMITLKRSRAPFRMWIQYILISVVSCFFVFLVNSVVMTGQNPILNVVVSGLVLTLTNFLLIDLQAKCSKENSTKYITKPHVTQKRNAIFIVVGAIVVVIIIVSIALFFFLAKPTTVFNDLNGEADTSLSIITMDEIAASIDKYSASFVKSSCHGEQTNVEGRLNEHDYDKIVFQCKQINGIKTMQATETKNNILLLEISSKINSGNLEIIIFIDDKYYTHVDINSSQTVIIENVANKLVVVKVAAECAELDFSISRKFDYEQ